MPTQNATVSFTATTIKIEETDSNGIVTRTGFGPPISSVYNQGGVLYRGPDRRVNPNPNVDNRRITD